MGLINNILIWFEQDRIRKLRSKIAYYEGLGKREEDIDVYREWLKNCENNQRRREN